ncbi:MAG: hypothetical protein C5B50_12225 [Verrucomicrobia bacterium]|nr:MAG: hypothetical protein C5B50_12225 [Verrucomicrobiota bacterium]
MGYLAAGAAKRANFRGVGVHGDKAAFWATLTVSKSVEGRSWPRLGCCWAVKWHRLLRWIVEFVDYWIIGLLNGKRDRTQALR